MPVQTPTSPAMARRHAVAAVAAAAAALFASPEAVHAAEAAACETSKTTGLTFCETLEGTGNPPVKGSLIRWGAGGACWKPPESRIGRHCAYAKHSLYHPRVSVWYQTAHLTAGLLATPWFYL